MIDPLTYIEIKMLNDLKRLKLGRPSKHSHCHNIVLYNTDIETKGQRMQYEKVMHKNLKELFTNRGIVKLKMSYHRNLLITI